MEFIGGILYYLFEVFCVFALYFNLTLPRWQNIVIPSEICTFLFCEFSFDLSYHQGLTISRSTSCVLPPD